MLALLISVLVASIYVIREDQAGRAGIAGNGHPL